jgi:hypothetical protein
MILYDITTNLIMYSILAENIEISIRRLPNAKVFAIQRSAEGESLGIKRDGGTAEVSTVMIFFLLDLIRLDNKNTKYNIKDVRHPIYYTPAQ